MKEGKILILLRKYKIKNNTYNFIILFLLGVLILILRNSFSSKSDEVFSNQSGVVAKTGNTVEEDVQELSGNSQEIYENNMSRELEKLLASIEGVGEVEVMMYFESGEESVPATNMNNSVSKTEEIDTNGGKRDTTQNTNGTIVVMENYDNDTKPFILKKYKPIITGIVVVAEGAKDAKIEFDIVTGVSSLFNIEVNKVKVYPMKQIGK